MNTEQTEPQPLPISQEKLLDFVHTMIGGSKGREDDKHPLPNGPWDPVVRVALERINFGPGVPWRKFGPHPEPWRTMESVLGYPVPWTVFGPSPEPWRTIESIVGYPVPQTVFGPSPEPWRTIDQRVIFARALASHSEIWDAIRDGHSFDQVVALNPQPLPPRFAFLISLAQTVISRAELFQEIADVTRREGEQHGGVSKYVFRFADYCLTGKPRWPFPGPPPPWWFANELNGIDLVVIATQFEQSAKQTFSADLRQNLTEASARLVEKGFSKMQ